MCTVSHNIETSRLNSYTCPHSFTPLASKAQLPLRGGRVYTKETGISRQHSAVRRGNGAKPEEVSRQYSDVNFTADASFSFLATSDFKMATPLILVNCGGGFLPHSPPSFQCLHLLSVFCNKVHT